MSHILSIIELHAALEEEKLAHQFAEKELAELKRDLLMQRDATKSQLDWGNQMQAERDALKARVAQLEELSAACLTQRIGARGLAHNTPVDFLVPRFENFHHPTRAIDRRTFFIARQQKCQRAFVLGVSSHETLCCGDHRGQAALHIGRSAAIEHSVFHSGFERIGCPLFARPRRHDIRMTCETQHRA